jgi:hypothetical protein
LEEYYLAATEFLQGQPGNNDFWFREGIVVPEPGGSVLILVGLCLVVCRKVAKP